MFMYVLFFFLVYIMLGGLFFCFFFLSKSFIFEYYLFSSFGLDFTLDFIFDFLSLGFFSCVSFISGVVFLYSLFYMDGTIDFRRFGWLVFLFVFSMFLLVFSGNFLMVMIGWDGLGLVSFCLVIFYSNSSSLESGLVTVFSNRVGDVFFLLSFLFFFSSGCLGFDSFCVSGVFLFMVFIFFGAITKSAQVPFSAWLPAAMAAPTPVSSLVHSSTLVTAGVYVLIRFNYLFSFFSMGFLKFFFVFTMILGGMCAVLETDLKKVVAMSTLSQLGMMMFVLSVGLWTLCFIHMIIHAFFKSMLFLSTGSLMSGLFGGQDSRLYGGGVYEYCTFLYFSVSCLCLAGFPFVLGFYSKDYIISSLSIFEGTVLYLLFLSGCIFTVVYSIRLIYISYLSLFKSFSYKSSREDLCFTLPVMLLFFKCWLLGGSIYWLFLVDFMFFLGMFDLFVGVFIMIIGILAWSFIKVSYELFFALGMIMFLRWNFSGGASHLFSKFFYNKYESTWMETFGGSGSYNFIFFANSHLKMFEKMSMGFFIFLMIFIIFYIY